MVAGSYKGEGYLGCLLEGAALRSRLRRSADPLQQMLDFYLPAIRR
ncbi:MAG TPA: hypothetical protein VM686_07890 [Polyangiaceae bacterium]|nr:hypothetical protein [Polyangiaceae bacterium]